MSKKRICLVTGATSGIGRAIAAQLVQDGHAVAFCGRSEGRVERAMSQFNEQGLDCSLLIGRAVDVEHADEIASFIKSIRSRFGDPSVLISNAGISPKVDGKRQALKDTPVEIWNQVLAVNLTATFHLAKALAPAMRKSGFGRIVLVGSLATRTLPKMAGAAYVASKAALSGLLRSMVAEFSGDGVTTNLVAPGNIATDMTAYLSEEAIADIVRRIPVKRLGAPEDVAALVAFLASDAASFINGATIDVNGGEVVAP